MPAVLRRVMICVAALIAWRSAASAQSSPSPSPSPSSRATPSPAVSLKSIGRTTARGRLQNLVGTAQSSSSGTVSQEQIETRPLQRAADVFETIPGVVVSQHSGEGKANQYYLRGFNLDHGTDLASSVAGIPDNMPTHAHGQGYSDVNWLIPELISYAEYKKGPYWADEGDFSTAGAIDISYRDSIPDTVTVGRGSDGEARLFVAGSPNAGRGNLLYALEYFHNDNSFDLPDNYRRYNGVLRYSRATPQSEFAATAMLYSGRWSATDQVPQRAVAAGRIDRFGAVDPTDGGYTHRNAVSLTYERSNVASATRVDAYGLDYGLSLFSNFTYDLEDPVNGDQINQVDKRVVLGLNVAHDFLRGKDVTTVGAGFRDDNIAANEVNHTVARSIIGTVTDDHVAQLSSYAYVRSTLKVGSKLRVAPGIRADSYDFHVMSSDAANSGRAHAAIVSPKLNVAYAFSPRFEAYVNVGESFHSNDARGTTIVDDPTTGKPVDAEGNAVERVTPLARAKGVEIGGRYGIGSRFNATVTLWQLDIASELTFDGDHGTTSAGFPTRRKGVEFTSIAHLTKPFTVDLDYAASGARYTRFDRALIPGNHVAGSLDAVTSSGLTYDSGTSFAALRYRYFGPRALVEDDSVRSRATTELNLLVGYRARARGGVGASLEILNLLNGTGDDIAYYYASRLRNETTCPDGTAAAAGCADVHFHPLDRRGFRLAVTRRF